MVVACSEIVLWPACKYNSIGSSSTWRMGAPDGGGGGHGGAFHIDGGRDAQALGSSNATAPVPPHTKVMKEETRVYTLG